MTTVTRSLFVFSWLMLAVPLLGIAQEATPAKTEEVTTTAKAQEDKPADAKPAETKVAEEKPADAKPVETKPAEAKPAEAKPADAKPEVKTDGKVDPMDWPHWRGPEMNGISREKGLVSSWDPSGENLIWKNPELATRSTPIILRGKIYTICRDKPETTQEGEKVVCADAATGKILWENVNNVFLSDAPAERVGWSSVTGDPATGHIFSHSLCGLFQCIDGETGKTLWTHSLAEEYGILSTYGGRTNIPTLFEDLIIASGVMTGFGEHAIPAHRFVAFDKRNGQAVWVLATRLRPEDTTYSTPIIGNFNGQAAMVFGAGDGAIYAVQPRTGKVIWKYEASIRGINQTPVIAGNTVFCSHAEETAADNSVVGAFFALDGTSKGDIPAGKEIWNVKGLAVGRSAPLLWNDRLYTINDAAGMVVLNAKNGEEIGKQKLGTIMFGSAVYGDGKIYVGEATGRWWILEPTEKGVKVIHKLRLEDEIIGSPVISHGRIYLPTFGGIYCIGNKDIQPSADPIPEMPPETPREADLKPAQAQLVPAESLLTTNQKQKFHLRLYNANGRYLKDAPVKSTLQGPGTMSDMGQFAVSDTPAHTVTLVKAESEGLAATARIRTVPGLPWTFDFNDKKVPATWIGAAYRYVPRDVDGESMLVKVTTIPKGTRSQLWMGPIDMHDYTIQSDFKGDIKNEKMPDMGVINQRYTLSLQGASQNLQIRSWTARLDLRFAKTVPFEWKPNTWYVMKFTATNEASKVVLKGKVWPRGDVEPETWSIEAIDSPANRTGSPGLFGNATDAEVFLDNVKVTANPVP
jgi:outer membrane protein assembly factor BamB